MSGSRLNQPIAACVLLATIAVSLLAASAAVARSRLPRVPPRYRGPALQVRPAVINTTEDGSGAFGGFNGSGRTNPGSLTWSSWTDTRAVAQGADWVDDCVPDCAIGKWHAYRATLILTDSKARVFRRLTVREVDHRKAITLHFTIVHLSGRYWNYDETYPAD